VLEIDAPLYGTTAERIRRRLQELCLASFKQPRPAPAAGSKPPRPSEGLLLDSLELKECGARIDLTAVALVDHAESDG
jgi:hypothetical protein